MQTNYWVTHNLKSHTWIFSSFVSIYAEKHVVWSHTLLKLFLFLNFDRKINRRQWRSSEFKGSHQKSFTLKRMKLANQSLCCLITVFISQKLGPMGWYKLILIGNSGIWHLLAVKQNCGQRQRAMLVRAYFFFELNHFQDTAGYQSFCSNISCCTMNMLG